MNYEGLTFVVDCSKNVFKSVNGCCYVLDPLVIPNPVNPVKYNTEVSVSNTDITPRQKKYVSESCVMSNAIEHGVTPITVNVVSSAKNIIKFYPVMIQSIYVKNDDKKQCDINYESTAFVSIVDKANVISKKFAINVIDKNSEDRNIVFPFVTANVTDKTQITVPDASELTGFTIILQKNNFTEIEFQKTLALATGLPEGLEQKGQIIKGTVTKSGSYAISITYSDGVKQTLNIIVPYYQRLL